MGVIGEGAGGPYVHLVGGDRGGQVDRGLLHPVEVNIGQPGGEALHRYPVQAGASEVDGGRGARRRRPSVAAPGGESLANGGPGAGEVQSRIRLLYATTLAEIV